MTSDAVRIHEAKNESQWRDLFENATRKYMTQSWAFGEAKRATGWTPRRIVLRDENEVLAICQVLHKSVAGVPVASRINLGPLMLDGHADKVADVYRTIRKRWRFLTRGVLLLAPALENSKTNHEILRSVGFRLRNDYKWGSSQLDLRESEEHLRGALNGKWRNQLKKAEHSELQFRSGSTGEDADWIIQRHSEHMGSKQFDGPSPELISALHRASPRDFIVYRASDGSGEDLAGIVVHRFGDHAHYYIGWNAAKGRLHNAGNFLLWNAALDLKRQGCTRFDLGGHSLTLRAGFNAFKLGMRGTCYETAGEYFCF